MSFDEKTVWLIQEKTQFNTDNIEKVLRLLEMFECKKLSQQAKVIYSFSKRLKIYIPSPMASRTFKTFAS